MPYGAQKRPANGIHKDQAGDTISSIAASYGFTDWEPKVWNASENAKLKEQRVNPNTLAPGDEVFIPELKRKDEGRPTDAWHDFHVVRNKRFLRLKVHDADDKPLASKKYEIKPMATFRGTFVQQGQTTDADGFIQEEIPHTLLEADLLLPEEHLHVHLMIGYLLPLPMTDPVKSAGASLDVTGALGSLGSGLMDKAGSLAGAASGALGAAGSLAGAGSGSLSIGGSGGSGGMSGGLGGGLGGAVSGATSALGSVTGAAQGMLSTAMATAGPLINAVAGVVGQGPFAGGPDKNVKPAAQRLFSMGFSPGFPEDHADAQFTGALLSFQTWCKKRGTLSDDAGGPLGGLTSPDGALGSLGGGGGVMGAIGGAVADMATSALASVGLTGQLDDETMKALKETHGS